MSIFCPASSIINVSLLKLPPRYVSEASIAGSWGAGGSAAKEGKVVPVCAALPDRVLTAQLKETQTSSFNAKSLIDAEIQRLTDRAKGTAEMENDQYRQALETDRRNVRGSSAIDSKRTGDPSLLGLNPTVSSIMMRNYDSDDEQGPADGSSRRKRRQTSDSEEDSDGSKKKKRKHKKEKKEKKKHKKHKSEKKHKRSRSDSSSDDSGSSNDK